MMEAEKPNQPSTRTAQVATDTLEQKILLASEQAAQVTSIFSPAIAEAIQAGVAVEPMVSGTIQFIRLLFHHHTGLAVPAAPAKA